MDIFITATFLILICLYMSWNIGSNDLANAMGTIIGSKVLTINQVIIIASLFEFLGAISIGGRVATTLSSNIVPLYKIFVQSENLLIYGMIASLLTSSFLVTLATFYSLPVSTSHSIVGSILGFGISCIFQNYLIFNDINWVKVIFISISWILSPFIGFILSFFIFYFLNNIFIKKNIQNIKLIRDKIKIFQIITSCFISFSHGSNDVSNSIAPLKGLILIFGATSFLYTKESANIIGYNLSFFIAHHWNVLLLMIGAFGIVIGFSTYGKKVIDTIGSNIIEMDSIKGCIAEFSTALIVLVHSFSAFPVSTTHVLVGSIVGIGIANEEKSINFNILKKILLSWILTVPLSSIFTMTILELLFYFFNPIIMF